MLWTSSVAYSSVLVVALATGCGADSVESAAVCETLDSQRLQIGEASPLGFSPLELIGNVVNAYTTTFDWADDTSSAGSIVFEYIDNTAKFEQRELVGEPEPGDPPCGDAVVLDMRALFESEDGRLDELLTFRGFASVVTELDVALALPLQLNGTLDVNEFSPGGTVTSAAAQLTADMTAIAGSISGRAEGDDFEVAAISGTVE